jgi:MFS family permease
MSEMARPLPTPLVRRSIRAAYVNAALWGVGSGLASTTLIVYLARLQGATGQAIGWILAVPSLVGLLRLAAPPWIDRVASRRWFCAGLFLASAAVLALLPLLAVDDVIRDRRERMFGVSAAWAGYQLLECIGVVGLWSWFGDLVPPWVRGRFLGRRESWLNIGAVVGTLAAIGVTLAWPRLFVDADVARMRPMREWQSYALCAWLGAGALAVGALSLLLAADAPRRLSPSRHLHRLRVRELTKPIADPCFRRFLTFGLWFSFSNGIVQTAQSLFPILRLELSFAARKTLDGGLRAAKAATLPVVGASVDRHGNVRFLAFSQGVIAIAPLFYLFATPAEPWWILGVYVCWLAYAGHDVTFPNIMLGLSPPGQSATYAAAWFAWTNLVYSLSVLAGGAAFDWLSWNLTPPSLGGRPFDHFALCFMIACVLKALGVALAARIPEPARLAAEADA